MAADYCSLATIKAEIPNLTDAHLDTRISRLITEASRLIDALCKRPDGAFVGQPETRRFDVPKQLEAPAYYTRDQTLKESQAEGNWPTAYIPVVNIDPLLSPQVVMTDSTGDGVFDTTWTIGTDCDFLPMNAPLDGSPYRQMRILPWGSQQLPIGIRTLQITGIWGHSLSVPPVIEQACILTVLRELKRPDAPFGVMGTAETGFVRLTGLDPDVKQRLVDAGYVRTWVFA